VRDGRSQSVAPLLLHLLPSLASWVRPPGLEVDDVLKRAYDPRAVAASDWYEHHARLMGEEHEEEQ
jgi:hypothetical protein